MDVLLQLPRETRSTPGHTDPTTVADELETQRSSASGAVWTTRATST